MKEVWLNSIVPENSCNKYAYKSMLYQETDLDSLRCKHKKKSSSVVGNINPYTNNYDSKVKLLIEV